jgi:hypothetical protein
VPGTDAAAQGTDAAAQGTDAAAPDAAAQGTDPGGRRARRRASLAFTVAAVLVGALAGAGLSWGNQAYVAADAPAPCGAGCVTNGSLYFSTDPVMSSVERKIAAQNATARSAGPYKTVVLLDPFTFSPGGTVSQARMTDELAGAFLAQQAANETRQAGKPGVQLLLANEGTSAEEGAAQAVAQIEAVQNSDNIVAVAGMGLSVAATQTDAMALAADHLPMFGAVTTGDTFNGVSFPGFYQVVPDVEAQVQALLPNPKVFQGQHLALISSGQAADIYSGDLNTDFGTAMQGAVLANYSFNPASGPAALGTAFADDAASVCGQPGSPTGKKREDPRNVLYAGRAADLPALIQVFQQSAACANQYVTIVTGSDANGLPASATIQSAIAGATVTVEYSDIESVYHLQQTFGSTKQTFSSTYPSLVGADAATAAATTCLNQRYDPWAVATFDGVMAAATIPVPASGVPVKPPVPATQIIGAAGPFAFRANGQLDAHSNAIPIYHYANGRCYPPGTGSGG